MISDLQSRAESTPRKSTVELIRYPAEAAAKAWPRAKPLLAKAIARCRGELAERHVFDAVLEARAQLWMAFDDGEPVAAAVTWVSQHPTGIRTFDIAFVGGMRRDRWLSLEPEFKAFAKQERCTRIKIPTGRLGWERDLRHWRKSAVVLELDLLDRGA